MGKRLILIASIFFLGAHCSCAQGEGSLKAEGGWNLKQSNTEKLDFTLKYSNDKLRVGVNAFANHSFLPTTSTTAILDGKKEHDEYYKGEEKTTNPRKLNGGVSVNFGYVFNPRNSMNAALGYEYTGTGNTSRLLTEREDSSSPTARTGTQIDTALARKHRASGILGYSRKFDTRPDALLDVNLTGRVTLNDDANRRIAFGDFYSKTKNYATYSSLNDFYSKLSASYDDVFNFGSTKLKMRAGLDLSSTADIDGYAAETNVGGVWRDSTRYRQSYYYRYISTEPYVNLTYTIGKFDFSIKERVQFYRHALLDKLEEEKTPEELAGLFDKRDIENLLNAAITYRINDRHRVALDYSRSISRPDYKKLCPTLMIGNSEGEYFIGNPDLLPETTDKINFNYTYTKRIFITKLDINYRDKRNTAEKIIDLEKAKDITDPAVKTVYTWINNKRQGSFGSRLNLKMNGQDVKAEIWAGFNYDVYWNNNKLNKEDFNYEIGTSIDVSLNETTRLSSSLAYISAKQSAYNLKGEDIIANLRLSKVLSKGLTLYLEIRDIVDKENYEETWNAAMNYLKVSSTNPMQRAIILGLNYAF